VFNYLIGRGLLLLRSETTDEHPTRIDILITDVRAMEIRSSFTGIEIAETDKKYLAGFQSKPVETVEVGNPIYSLDGHPPTAPSPPRRCRHDVRSAPSACAGKAPASSAAIPASISAREPTLGRQNIDAFIGFLARDYDCWTCWVLARA
jgi:hypothetical protein